MGDMNENKLEYTSFTNEKGTDAEKDAITNDAMTVWNYLSVKGLSGTEIAGFRGNMILERSGKENL